MTSASGVSPGVTKSDREGPMDGTRLSKADKPLLKVYLVLDDAFLLRQQTREVPNSPSEEESSAILPHVQGQDTPAVSFSDFKLTSEHVSKRPFFEEYLRYLLSADPRVRLVLCLKAERPKLIGLAMQIFAHKRLKELRNRVIGFCDEHFFNPNSPHQLNLSALPENGAKRLIISSSLEQAQVHVEPMTRAQVLAWNQGHSEDEFD